MTGEWHGEAGLPPLVLASGLSGLAAEWEPVLTTLAQDYRVLVWDRRADGTIADDAADLAGLLAAESLDEPAAVVGVDAGGLIALQLALDAPDRVSRLMVVNGWGAIDPHTGRWLRLLDRLLQLDPTAAREAEPLWSAPPGWTDDDPLPATDPAVMRARIAALWAWNPGAYRLGTIAAPTLCLATEDDALVPPAASEALAGLLPRGQFASLATGGHAVHRTRPADVALRIRDWVR